MNTKELDRFLREFDDIEKLQYKTHENINDFDGYEMQMDTREGISRMQDHYFFDQGHVFISKHHRFAPMPRHVHAFIEINYMYSGTCTQYVDGQEIQLFEGQVCLMDSDVPHSIEELGMNDILVNVIMKKKTFLSAFLGKLSSHGLVTEFLVNAISENQKHDQYIIFHSEKNKELHDVFEKMMCEFFDPADYSSDIIHAYLPVMFIELMRVYKYDINFDRNNEKAVIAEILQYMEEHYQDCTLSSLAEEFNFNKNYLGNLLKERTGKTFIEFIQMQRMIQAANLLANTDVSIEQAGIEAGYESTSFFYRKFKKYFGMTPKAFRENKRTYL
ncbi:AraC-like DNA-binding protein/mannose-6-phosphate isomerase-like protein (cupin superfamily) [Salibacterium salarium]|uniref:AraC family transcriptional regulator n=1 Tax=Salibacterium salarium TaxID=284579 RepID=UPI002787819F|nr:helix-turn-helix domain-containing protein [Salibacterium salarium]MDQ0300278.1 AraC-like DNA-binding protein/mannose-6-phosphate isomerase-like protein (cupin superfamily) [Salibacterium salarium]